MPSDGNNYHAIWSIFLSNCIFFNVDLMSISMELLPISSSRWSRFSKLLLRFDFSIDRWSACRPFRGQIPINLSSLTQDFTGQLLIKFIANLRGTFSVWIPSLSWKYSGQFRIDFCWFRVMRWFPLPNDQLHKSSMSKRLKSEGNWTRIEKVASAPTGNIKNRLENTTVPLVTSLLITALMLISTDLSYS